MPACQHRLGLRWWIKALFRMPIIGTIAVVGGGAAILHFCLSTAIATGTAASWRTIDGVEAYHLIASYCLLVTTPFLIALLSGLHRRVLLHRGGELARARVLAVKTPWWLRLEVRRRVRIEYEFQTTDGKSVKCSTVGTYHELFGGTEATKEISIRYLSSDPTVNDVALLDPAEIRARDMVRSSGCG